MDKLFNKNKNVQEVYILNYNIVVYLFYVINQDGLQYILVDFVIKIILYEIF